MYIILVYDISIKDKGQRRWRRTFKICKKYLTHIQNSVFEGDILESDLYILKQEIKKEINKELDSVLIFKSRDERWLNKEILGLGLPDTTFI